MNLQIISPLRILNYDVAWLEVNTNVGNFVIQKGHVPTLLVLSPNEEIIFRLKNGKEESIMVSSGIVEVTREKSTVIIHEQQ
jgi:F0F1-type ATP synthase epsilon subunit